MSYVGDRASYSNGGCVGTIVAVEPESIDHEKVLRDSLISGEDLNAS
jgi:hypothetical protein